MPQGRALRTLNVNPETKQKPIDHVTVNAAFSCVGNDFASNKCLLERSVKNSQLLKENKLVKQLEQETLVMEQQAASTSRLDPPLDSLENSEFANFNGTEETDDPDYFPPTGLLYASPDMHEPSHTTAVENTSKVSGSLASSSNNIVADLHEKLCSSHPQTKKRANGKRSQSSDTDDSLPLLNTIVNEILSLETDFPLPSTLSGDFDNSRSTTGGRRRYKRTYARKTLKRYKKQRVDEDLASASSIPSTSIDNTASGSIPVLSGSDSDCEITGYIPSHSRQINTSSEVPCRNSPELNIFDISVLELGRTSGSLVSQSNSDETVCTNNRLDSIINTLNGAIQRLDDDIMFIDTTHHQGNEQAITIEDGTNLNMSVIEIGSTNEGSQLTPPVITVSDDEDEPTVKPALSKQLKSTPTELSPQQDAASSKGRKWHCPICWEELTSARGVNATVCGHVFCNPCINKVLKKNQKCPMCRQTLTRKKVHPLFLND